MSCFGSGLRLLQLINLTLLAATKPVGILGLAPENEDAYVEQLPSAKALVTASGPTPFAFKLGDKVRNRLRARDWAFTDLLRFFDAARPVRSYSPKNFRLYSGLLSVSVVTRGMPWEASMG